LGRCKQKQRGLSGLLCRWPSITEWEMHITAQDRRLRNDLYCVEWDVKLYYTIPSFQLHILQLLYIKCAIQMIGGESNDCCSYYVMLW